jgi:hypothetical protein
VPTVRLDHLTEAQAKAFLIADNRLAETSAWDERLLAEALKDLSALELDFSIEVTGFEVGEIDFRIESLDKGSHERDDSADALPPLAEEAVSQVEDLWLLGDHRVYCGNVLDARAHQGLMAGERAVMVFSDPPYNVRIDGHASGLGRVHHREFAMASGEMGTTEYVSFLTIAYSMLARDSIDGSMHFICSDWRHTAEVMEAGATAYSELKNICVWAKQRRNGLLLSKPT